MITGLRLAFSASTACSSSHSSGAGRRGIQTFSSKKLSG
jgi:hypothetical protein